jgi:hypothetical protein
MSEKTGRTKSNGVMHPLPVRRSSAEGKVIKALAKSAKLSEARLMVTAALMLADFRTEEELRVALHLGGQLWQTRTSAVMQIRKLGHQLERLQEEVDPQTGTLPLSNLNEALGEVAIVLRKLGASWHGQSRK